MLLQLPLSSLNTCHIIILPSWHLCYHLSYSHYDQPVVSWRNTTQPNRQHWNWLLTPTNRPTGISYRLHLSSVKGNSIAKAHVVSPRLCVTPENWPNPSFLICIHLIIKVYVIELRHWGQVHQLIDVILAGLLGYGEKYCPRGSLSEWKIMRSTVQVTHYSINLVQGDIVAAEMFDAIL